jgi:G3E family GTPase
MIISQLAGFFGSGKTTLLVRMGTELSKAGKKVAIIVNEVGEVGVDGAVIDSFGLRSVEITEGCICCSLSGSLQNTLRMLARDFRPDVIIIEPTGIALPSKIKQLVRTAMVGEDGMFTICLVDAFRATKLYAEAQQFFTRQVEGSDVVAVNKIDLVDVVTKEKVADIITGIVPDARIAFISAKDGTGVPELISAMGVGA